MQVVHVLRDHVDLHGAAVQALQSLGQLGDGQVPGVRLRGHDLRSPPFVPGPNALLVGLPAIGRGEFLRVELLPVAARLPPKGGNAAFGRHACACEDDDAARLAQGVGNGLCGGGVHGVVLSLGDQKPSLGRRATRCAGGGAGSVLK
jgi:hypothetical protein